MAEPQVSTDVAGIFWGALGLTLVAALIDNGMLGWAVAFVVVPAFVYVMSRVPLRYSLAGFMYAAFLLENPNEMPAGGLWQSPIFNLGALALTHLNNPTGVSWLSFSGLDFLLVCLIVITVYRNSTGSKIDREGHVPSPPILTRLCVLSLVGTAYVLGRGFLSGGDMQKALWQVEKVIYLPILVLLFQVAVRSPGDAVLFGRVILTAACARSALAAYVMYIADIPGPDPPPHATSHHDSVLFACAFIILVSMLMHRARRNAGRVTLMILPLLLLGMVANNRRMVWVQIMLVLLTLYGVTPLTPAKRSIKKWVVRLSPLIVAYCVVGWRSSSAIFKPVGTIRSVVEPATDVSTMTRDIENYDISMTIRQNPIMGSGYGNGYLELIQLPPMPYPLERYLPHNSTLGLWMAAGFIGYTAITLLWGAGVFFGVRAYVASRSAMERTVALVVFAAPLIYLIQCYGDVGLGAFAGVYTVAPAIAIAGKLAVATGAWPMKGFTVVPTPATARRTTDTVTTPRA